MFFLPKKVMSPFKNTIRATSYVKDRLQEGLHTFIHHESFGGVLLFFCVDLEVLIANS